MLGPENEVCNYLALEKINEILGFALFRHLSGQRCQTIHALSTRDMQVSDSKVVFIVNELLKTSRPGKYPTKLEFLSFDNDLRLCVVRIPEEDQGHET